MQKNTQTKASAKTSTETKKVENLAKFNFDKFADKLANVNLKEKTKRETIYIYPEDMTEADINTDKGKRFRNKLRNEMQRFCNNIFVYAKTKNAESLQSEIEKFKVFYKKNYRINDFSLSSISNTKNEAKEANLKIMLEIIKESMK